MKQFTANTRTVWIAIFAFGGGWLANELYVAYQLGLL